VEIINYGVWFYGRFSLSYRDVHEMRAERGVIGSHAAVRYGGRQFGQEYANQLPRRRPQSGDKWFLDAVFLTINGTRLSVEVDLPQLLLPVVWGIETARRCMLERWPFLL
jgi:transposase-like protein